MTEGIFNHIDIKIDWGFIFGFISVLSIAITWLIRTFRDSSKEIGVKEVSIETILNKPNELINDLKVILNGEEIEQLNKIELYFQNSGSKTLNHTDYHILPQINLSGFTNIISINISSSNDITTCISEKLNSSLLELKIDNLEPKEYMRIDILFESISDEYESTFEFRLKENKIVKRDLKEYRIDKNFGISKDYNAFMTITSLAGLVVFGLSYFLTRNGLGVDLSDPGNFSIGWKVLFFSPTILTCLFVIYKWNKTIKNHHFGYKKVSKWHDTTGT